MHAGGNECDKGVLCTINEGACDGPHYALCHFQGGQKNPTVRSSDLRYLADVCAEYSEGLYGI